MNADTFIDRLAAQKSAAELANVQRHYKGPVTSGERSPMKPCISFHVLLLFVFCLLGCNAQTTNAPATVTNKLETPNTKPQRVQGHALPGLEHGMCQSPINIFTSSVKSGKKHRVVFDYKHSSEKVKNLGHTVEVEYEPGSTISFDGKTFEFKQFHFHTPAEHLIDGITYPMEMHMVHTLKGQTDKAKPTYLVIGLLFKQGSKNTFLNKFLDAIPKEAGQEKDVRGGAVNINDLLKQAKKLEYYRYAGSLTTPPYTETVTWLIVSHIFEAAPDQIDTFKRVEGNNARHVQALYGREVDKK